MPQSSNERVAAYRERQRAAQAAAEREASAALESQAAEDRYVEEQLAVTRHLLDTGLLKDEDADGNPLQRLARSERYARYRWRGVQDGSIAAL